MCFAVSGALLQIAQILDGMMPNSERYSAVGSLLCASNQRKKDIFGAIESFQIHLNDGVGLSIGVSEWYLDLTEKWPLLVMLQKI